jgi:large subunit ribosomal protein L35
MKTHQAIAKRLKLTKTGKLMKRKAGQNHFNSREGGKVTRAKRRDFALGNTHAKNFKQLMPFAK